jgi:hypothetical protein
VEHQQFSFSTPSDEENSIQAPAVRVFDWLSASKRNPIYPSASPWISHLEEVSAVDRRETGEDSKMALVVFAKDSHHGAVTIQRIAQLIFRKLAGRLGA